MVPIMVQLPNIFNIFFVNYMPLPRDQCFVNEFQCDKQSFDVDCTMMEIKAFTKNGFPPDSAEKREQNDDGPRSYNNNVMK